MGLFKRKGPVYSVIGTATDDGSTFIVAMVLRGDVTRLLAGEDRPQAGSVLYVVPGQPGPHAAANRALEAFERDAADGADAWERGEVFYL